MFITLFLALYMFRPLQWRDIVALSACLMLCGYCPAAAAPTDDAKAALATTLDALKASSQHQKALKQKTETLERELRHLQEKVVLLARDTELRAQELAGFEEKLAILAAQKAQEDDELRAHQSEYAQMLGAMIKLRAMPPAAVIAMPGGINDTFAAARALQLVTRALAEEAESLRAQLRELGLLEDKIHANHDVIAAKKTALDQARRELAEKIQQRAGLQAALGGQAKNEKDRVAALTAKSKTLEELVDSLQRAEDAAQSQAESAGEAIKKRPKARRRPHLRSFAAAAHTVKLPAGHVEAGGSGAFSKGVLITLPKASDVVAPFDGEVVFAGPFRDYGRMVILRHSEGYHTLLSGMERVNCTIGQFLISGEPLGSMGDAPRPLYIELRKSGAPINPMTWFKE